MTIKSIRLSVLALTFALTYPALSFAHDKMHQEDWILKVSEKLNLNAEQKVKIKLYAHKAKIEIRLKHHELRTICKHINESFHSGNMNEAKIDDFANQKTKVLGSIIKIRLHERYDIYQTLQPKQRETMDNMIEAWHDKNHKE